MSTTVICRVLENRQVQVVAGNHSWVADEPGALHGDGLGPNPFDMLLAAVGTCTALEVSVRAAREGLPLELTRVELAGRWSNEENGKRYHIVRRIDVRGDVTEEDEQRIRQWAEHCPVGTILQQGVDLETEVRRLV